MNKKLIYLSILLIGFSASAIYGTGSIVTDTDVSTPLLNAVDGVFSNSVSTKDLTVTGTCTGCGSGSALEGSFTTWTLFQDINESSITIQSTGSIIDNNGHGFMGANQQAEFFLNGTLVHVSNPASLGAGDVLYPSSISHKYILDETSTGGIGGIPTNIKINENGTILQTITTDVTKFTDIQNLAISPDGKYIVLEGNDKCNCGNERVQIWQGS